MKTKQTYAGKSSMILIIALLSMFTVQSAISAPLFSKKQQRDTTTYVQFSGSIVDSKTGDPLTFATLTVEGTNIATVCNSDGEFLLKVPKSMTNKSVVASYIGYSTKTIPITSLKSEREKIKLDMITVSLAEINVFPNDPNYLIRAVLNKRGQNYMNDAALMTAFYRETIKKGWSYVSLSEAVVEVLKQPFNSSRPDAIRLFKGRKSADYTKLDTLTFKLMGGPYSTLMLDVIKNPYAIFTDDILGFYDFNITNITRVNDKLVYVMEFKQKANVDEPLFFGKLYIDSESLAITSAAYNLNVSNRSEAAGLFIKKKPAGAEVYPTEASYLVNYRQTNGKWIYGYSRGQITFKVNWLKRLFNTSYYTTIEMAVTDWQIADEKNFKGMDRMKTNVIVEDAVAGFADKDFWGEYNVIEPEQSIDAAIKKIQKNLGKTKN